MKLFSEAIRIDCENVKTWVSLYHGALAITTKLRPFDDEILFDDN